MLSRDRDAVSTFGFYIRQSHNIGCKERVGEIEMVVVLGSNFPEELPVLESPDPIFPGPEFADPESKTSFCQNEKIEFELFIKLT
ncbi:hypothetical protein NDU88_006477 [Pleurodeles waltl]|uniref:Reverse transcriptase domain-containing protein n=1 Tax=Pleurodeles waltl TaxID=8319 RepID=A0AAV7X182_PLEWA|nr:hypothetical protein NDU88_006477 [Pleurodeles waltl]